MPGIRRSILESNGPPTKASLFVTCIVDQFYPNVGESAYRVLRRLGVEVDFIEDQTCCGQPAFNSGFWKHARPLAEKFLKQFEKSEYIVLPSGSCASMVRVFFQELFHDDPALQAKARDLAPRVYEFTEFIVDVLGVEDLSSLCDADSPVKVVTFHEACHLKRELNVSRQPRTLIRSIPGVELKELNQVEVCCGFGGVFSVKYPEISAAMLQDKLDDIRSTGVETVISCDSSCLMQIGGGMDKQGISVEPQHVAEFLAEALAVKA